MNETGVDYTGFFRAEYQTVVRTVELIVCDHETALDLTQDAFARLYRHWRKVSRYENPAAWVRRVAVNLAISHLRRRKLQERTLGSLVPIAKTSPDQDGDVLAAVRALPPSQRAAIVLFYFEDQPTSEIARILDCSESTARVHLHKARIRLAGAIPRYTSERSTDVIR